MAARALGLRGGYILFAGRVIMQDEILLKITVITDDSTGIYQIGELDFGKTGHCESFLEKPENREMFVEHLRWLADAAENGTSPFLPYGELRTIPTDRNDTSWESGEIANEIEV